MQAITTIEDLFTASVETGPIHAIPYKTVHTDDREAVTLVEPNYKDGPWIAGGAPLRWWQGKPVGESDIDIFCRDAVQADEVITRIKNTGRSQTRYESENATTISYWPKTNNGAFSKRWTLQIIKRRYFKSLKEVIEGFDITVCEIGTCGNEWELGETTARDIRAKVLNFNEPLQQDALKRLVKYWVYGYTPLPGTIEAIQNNPDSKWKYSFEEDYANAF